MNDLQNNNGNSNNQQQEPGNPLPKGNKKLAFHAKVRDVLNLPAGMDLDDKVLNLYVVQQEREKGYVHWAWIAAGVGGGIGLGVGGTLLVQHFTGKKK